MNLRVVADRENLPALPALAKLAVERGWLDQPESRFKPQIGRNYELFGCASRQGRDQLFDRLAQWTEYVALSGMHPELRRFHQPRLHGMCHLAETGEWPPATFDSCPAAKKEWAFAPDGGVYGFTATVGHRAPQLGTCAPTIDLNEDVIANWRTGRFSPSQPAKPAPWQPCAAEDAERSPWIARERCWRPIAVP